MKKLYGALGLIVVGILILFAGSAVATAEEGAANSIGTFLTNKWVAIALIAAGGFWFAAEEGYLSKKV